MKKIFLFAALILSINLAGQDVKFGIHFDPLISWFSPNTKHIDKDGSKLGFSGGLMIETAFKENYIFATGIDLAYMGGNILYKEATNFTVDENINVLLDSATTVEYTLQYISIPLSLKLKTNAIGYISYFGQLGFTPQFNVSAKATSTKSTNGNMLDKDNVGKEIGLFNLSFFIGGGIDYALGGNTVLNLGIFYNNGFIDQLSSETHKASLKYASLRLGVMF
jgi:hypothetical protein